MSAVTNNLDTDELLHLAIDASKQNRNEDAIRLLKQALEAAPDNGSLHYMLGAMYAEIGMYDRAVNEMAESVKLDPSLYTAHFQLGLLLITAGEVEQAREAWQPLDELGAENSLFLFKTGMLQMAEDQFEDCITSLEQGIRLNSDNTPLNNDMQRMLDLAKEALGNQANTAQADNSDETGDADHVFLNAYKSDDFEQDP